jgi:hypothetical protein
LQELFTGNRWCEVSGVGQDEPNSHGVRVGAASEKEGCLMSEAFYSRARLYDLMFPGGGPAVDFTGPKPIGKAEAYWSSGAARGTS